MKVKDLIAALKDMDPELEVYGYCDHGQSPEKVSAPSIIYTTGNVHSLDYDWTDNFDDAVDDGYDIKAVLL